MLIDRISRITNHRVFRAFVWPQDLPDFKTKNLIYGWNGSGKSTLSNLFRSIEKKSNITEGEVEFSISGQTIHGSALSTSLNLPEVRVFNQGFVRENVFTGNSVVAPIFYIGKESIDKQKEVEKLIAEIALSEQDAEMKGKEKTRAEKALETFKTDQARSIKQLLSSSGINVYNSYNKSNLERKTDEMFQLPEDERQAKTLRKNEFERLRTKTESNPKEKLPLVIFDDPGVQVLTERVAVLLNKTVVSCVIESLQDNPDLSTWTRTGLDIHKAQNSSACLFCGQPMPSGRLQQIEAHFNDEYTRFLGSIETTAKTIQTTIDNLKSVTLPDQSRFYDHFQGDYNLSRLAFEQEIGKIVEHLKILIAALDDKVKKPFQSVEKQFTRLEYDTKIGSKINAVIGRHNHETDNFQDEIIAARKAIEESVIVELLSRYKQSKEEAEAAAVAFQQISNQIAEKNRQKSELERQIYEHRIPAAELNADIRAYLGRDELTFEPQENGYQICRSGTPTDTLSEGEETAFALLYFLKSLSDKSFNLEKGVVVIDDPVSSLDSNSIYCAFGFIKARTKDAGQLLVLTHNYALFQQIKKWLSYLKKSERGFYMIETLSDTQGRYACVKPLDPFLEDYASEYQYLYSIVWKCANNEAAGLSDHCQMPNIARRLLEGFLSFKQPHLDSESSIDKRLQNTQYDEAKKARILRFTNTLSHHRYIETQPNDDPSILSETPSVLRDILAFMAFHDSKHCQAMEKAISNQQGSSA
jgi:wobble nucleotide-excising tRNase